jgi:amidase
VDAIYQANIDSLREAGATIIDEIRIDMGEMNDASYEVLLYEFRADLNSYLKDSSAPVQSLADLIEYNEAGADAVMPVFGQEVFLESEAKGPLTDEAYLSALDAGRGLARQTMDDLFAKHALDALIGPTNGPAWMIDHINGDSFGIGSSSLAAISGYPNITVPAGFVSGMPVGLSFMGLAWNEKQLIEIAYAFEQTTGIRTPPEF